MNEAGWDWRAHAPRMASFFLLFSALSFLIVRTWQEDASQSQTAHFGDDADYLLTTQSFVNHGTPDARPEDPPGVLAQLGPRWAWSIRKKYQDWPKLPAYYPDRSGHYYSWHFWTYAAYVSVFKARLDRAGQGATAFALANTVAFCVALLSLLQLWNLPRVWPALVPLAFFTPLLWFLPLAHTEPFVFSLALIAVACHLSERYLLATLFGALAATQFQPLSLLAGVSVFEGAWAQFSRPVSPRRRVLWFAGALLACAPIFVPSLFYFRHYGVTSLITREGFAASRLMSFDKFRSLFVDFDTGMIVYLPGLLLLLMYGLVLVVRRSLRGRRFRYLLPWAAVALALWGTTSALNWNYHTQGISRYALYLTPGMLLLVGLELKARPPRNLTLALLALAFALQFKVHDTFGWFQFKGHNGLHHNIVANYVLRRWPSLYAAPGEIFCSRTLRRRCLLDLHTGLVSADELPVIYDGQDGRARKALASTCAPERLLGARAWTERDAARIRRALDPCRPGRLAYVDFD